MNSLKVPDSGLLLEGPSSSVSALPPQAFSFTLTDDVVEQLIRSARQGDGLELQLGKNPTLRYGSNSHRILAPTDEAPFDLYLTQPFESTRRADRLPQTGSLFKKPQPSRSAIKTKQGTHDGGSKQSKNAASSKSSSSGLDSDIEALQNGLAAHDAARERARVVAKLPATKKAAGQAKGKLLSNYSSPVPTSPALNGARSPNASAMSASQQAMERKKEQRFALVHELAVKDRTTEYLKGKWPGKDEDFRPTLEKMADQTDSKTWTMKKSCWKELDVWKYKYGSQDERQTAIDNAIRQYDKQRLSSSEVEWQRLLPKEERGKGKCLSRLQANLAKGPQSAPKIKVQKADDSSGSKDDGDSFDGERPKAKGGESMSRSNSNPMSKPKKPTAQEAQAKRLLSKSKPAPKTSPTKGKGATAKNGGRILSAAIIENSDSSGDEAPPLIATKPKPAPAKATAKAKAKDTVVVNTRPTAAEPVKKQQPVKRAREDSDSSSSSGTPLSKRIKPRQPIPAPSSRQREVIKPSQQQQSSSYRSKNNNNTSPTKSSPLASSPPTNASDLDEDSPPLPPPKKRKMETSDRPMAVKRRAVEVVPENVMSKAHKFKTFYQKYEALHYEITALDNPPHEKLADLLDMRGRLENMKREIYKQYSPER